MSNILGNIEAIIGLISGLALIAGAFYFKSLGRDAEKLDQAENELEQIDTAKKARESLTDDKRDRLRGERR